MLNSGIRYLSEIVSATEFLRNLPALPTSICVFSGRFPVGFRSFPTSHLWLRNAPKFAGPPPDFAVIIPFGLRTPDFKKTKPSRTNYSVLYSCRAETVTLIHPHSVLGPNPNPNPLTQRLASGACASTLGLVGARITFTKHTPPLEALIECKHVKK